MSAKSLQKPYAIHEVSEKRAYCKWINRVLVNDKDCEAYLPLDSYGEDLYSKVKDGVLLCKLLYFSLPNSIDTRAINVGLDLEKTYSKQIDNLSLMFNAARCRGADMGNISINEIINGNKFTILDCIWQIIRIGFFNQINIYHHPEIMHLKKTHESMDDVRELSPYDLILRYANLHVQKNGLRYFINDFDDDFKDCLVYGNLVYRVAPVNLRMQMTDPITMSKEKCVEARARDVISNLKVLSAECFLTEDDLLNGFQRRESACKLHLGTMTYLFIYYNGDLPTNIPVHHTKSYGTAGECLDEIMCKNFLNSFNVYPFINHLFTDCRNGWVFSEMFEILKPGITSGMKFILNFDIEKSFGQRVFNNLKVIKLCGLLPLECGNLNAEKLADSEKSSILSIILEIMRYYFCRDGLNHKEIVQSINTYVFTKQRDYIKSLSDPLIIENNILGMILEKKAPGLINKSFIGSDKLKNLKYLISIAHKAGIPIYALPEHFINGNANFTAIAFATVLSY